jgi:hypothetical protein
MVSATLTKGCEYLGRIPSNVKFINETQLEDGSYLSFINPPGKFRKKGFEPIQIRVIEYTIENLNDPTAEIRYRLITSLLDSQENPAKLLADVYHQRWKSKIQLMNSKYISGNEKLMFVLKDQEK